MSDVFSPYPGLRPFYSDEAHLFFGREEQTDELLRRLHENRFLAVVGPSGCGKSSLVRAGMVPALESGFMTRAGSRWVFAVMRPGSHPMHRLALSLTKDAGLGNGKDDESAAGLLGATLRRGPLGLLEALRERPLSAGTNLLVLVDQFEEVFRFHSEGGSDEADAFVALLLESARQREQQIYVVLTMRSDFFGECAVFSGLPEMLNESQYLTPRLTREQRRAAITGPARVFGGDVAPDLINRLLNEMGSDPDQLPLMQHLLMRMWTWHPNSAGTEPEGGEPRRLTLADYEAVGGLRHALSNHASEAFEKLSPAQQSVAEILFRRLSERQPGSRDIRRPTPAGEVAELARASIKELTDVVDVFRAPGCSFVVPPLPEPIDAHSMLDISHEALIRQWDRLREWGEQEAQSAEQYKFLEQNAQLWKQGRMALWGTPNLEVALDWRERTRPTSLWAKRYGGDFELAAAFLDASARAREAHETALKEQRQRQVRRLQRMIAASVVLAMLLGGALGSAYWVLFQEHASYYRYFTKHWGEPVGYGSLTAEQVQHRDFSLKFVRRGIHTGFRWRELFDVGFWTGNGESHPVVRIEAVNSRDECTPVNSIATYIEPDQEGYTPLHECRFLFVRDDTTGRMVYEKAYDKNGNLRWGFAYTPVETDRKTRMGYYLGKDGSFTQFKHSPAEALVFEYSDDGKEVRATYVDRARKPQPGPDHAYGRRFEYDAKGRLAAMTSVDKAGQPMNDTAGNATLRMEYDAEGNVVREMALDAAGTPVLVKSGFHERDTQYDRFGRPVESSELDAAKQPAHDGVNRIRTDYSDDGSRHSTSYFDAAGKPTLSQAGYHTEVVLRTGAWGRALAWAFFGLNGEAATDAKGVHEYDAVYDDRGFEITERSFDLQHQPVAAESGCFEVRAGWDDAGNLISRECFGQHGERDLFEDGSHREVREYDPRGNMTEWAYFNAENQPMICQQGYHLARAEYDQMGDRVDEAFFGIKNEQIRNEAGYHRRSSTFDNRGNETERSFYDEQNRLTLGPDGYARLRMSYDGWDNQIEKAYYGLDDNLTETSRVARGYAVEKRAFDDHRREIEVSYFGQHGIRKPGPEGFATERIHYGVDSTELRFLDAEGHPVPVNNCAIVRSHKSNGLNESTCLNEDGQPTLNNAGFSIVRMKHDDHGREVERAYYDQHNSLVRQSAGWAIERSTYDDRGNKTEQSYLDERNGLVLGPDGYAQMRMKFDDKGRRIEVQLFGSDGKLTDNSKAAYGYAVSRVTYNGSLLELRYYDPQERPVKVNGCELMRGEIGPRNKLLSITCLDAEGRVAVSAAGFATARMKYDEQGHQLEAAYFDQSDRPVLYQGKYAVIRNKVDEGGHEVERAYLGTDGKLHQLPDGYAIERMVYDSQGRLGQKTLYGDDAQLVGRIAYDPVGHETEHAYFKSGRLQMTSWGYAVLRAAYDDAGAPLVNTFFNEREQLIARCPPSHERGEFVPSHGCISADSRPVVTRPIVVKVDPQSKAERIGLQAGDLIESYDGREVFRPAELIQLVRESGAGSHKLTLRRGDRKLEFTIEQGRLGIGIDTRFQTEPGPQAANASGPGQ